MATKTKTKAELEAYIAELEAKIERMDSGAGKTIPAAPVVSSQPVYTPTSTDVTIVYTSHSLGHMEGSQFSLDASVYGERFTLTRPQFDELVGKYRRWFNDGILAVASECVAVAAAKGLPIEKDNGLSVAQLHSLGEMSVEEIESLWANIKYMSLKQSVVCYFKECFENDVPGYRDRARVDCLNRLTDGAFDYETKILSGRPIKLEPRDLMVE